MSPFSQRENSRLRRSIKMLLATVVLMAIKLALAAYLTVPVGKECEMLRYLQEQQQEYSHHGKNTVTKRAIPWILGALLWTGNQVFAFYSLATSCSEFSSSAGNAATCIWGEISTAASFIGAGTQVAWKRDVDLASFEADIAHFGDLLSNVFQLPVIFDGYMRHDHPRLKLLSLFEGTSWHVFHMHNYKNTRVHLTVTALHDTHMVMPMGFGAESNHSSIAKREAYNDEYFTNGGIDFTSCWENEVPHYTLSTGSDYQQMDRDIECYFPDLSNTWGADVQIYDSNKHITIGAGTIAAFRGSDHASSVSVMSGCRSGVQTTDNCDAV
ncbi:hypothetical protein BDV36DRAFT_293149 [Aspergillus pseudocaelatus]|uniref:Pectin lyase fold/virulence factor n=1 Tax=Aspergillus pseudocaelatus TaxID=1825620 RepID=A0ABQ6WTQ9_9EURO|nr:hypothetical protein BDV36DRAFT_293149 [Aspergillus pseudocaelatus]